MATSTIAVGEAKNRFSSLLREVEQDKARFIIENRGRKVARLVPYEQPAAPKSFGALAEYANPNKRTTEAGAAERAVAKAYAAAR